MHGILISLLLAVSGTSGEPPDIVVICPTQFRETMQPWVEHRTKQGHVVRFISNLGAAEEVQQRIREVAHEGRLRFVVLVGDVPPRTAQLSPRETSQQSRFTPTFRVPSKVDRYWGGGPDFASDNPYADLDDDGLPDLAVGRMPAHTAEELSAMLDKTLAYEQCVDFGAWRTKINFIAGQGGFGELADSALETVVRKAITLGVPSGYLTTLTYASWHSAYCPDPHTFHDCCLQRFNEHALFWVFMGHGSPRALEPALFPDCMQSILGCDDCRTLHCDIAAPIALFFCCYAGAFADPQACLAEELLRNPHGPAVVLAGSSVTMPYSMSALGWQAMREYFVEHRQSVGELFMHAKREAIVEDDLPILRLLSALTATMTPNYSSKDERRECVQLFNLFGDPTLALYYPRPATVSAPSIATAGHALEVQGECPFDGPAIIELLLPRDRLRNDSPPRDKYGDDMLSRKQFEQMYQTANDPRLATAETHVVNGRFSATLTPPGDAQGVCNLRVFAIGVKDCALGACNIQIVAGNVSDKQALPKPAALLVPPIGAAVVSP